MSDEERVSIQFGQRGARLEVGGRCCPMGNGGLGVAGGDALQSCAVAI